MAHIGETELDLRALGHALRTRGWLLALIAILAAIATYVGLSFVDPLYTADTRILIEERESPLTRPRDDTGATSSDFDESAIQSHVEVLRSRGIADAVVDELQLTTRPEFDPATRPSVIRSLLVMLGLGEHPADASIRQRVMESYFERLTVYPVQKSRVIGVEFSAPNPDLAAEVANAVANAFVVMQQDAKRQSAVAATLWLEQEIERLRERVAEAEQAVADYRERSGLFDVEQRGIEGGNLSTQQLGDLNAELARARAARAEAEARAQSVQSLLDDGGALESSAEVLNSQLVQRLRERQVALRAQMAELSTTLLPGHPRIRALQGQIANLEEQIREEAEKILASLQTAARVAAAREESLVESLNAAKGDVSRSNDQEIQLRALEREAAAQRELLESFLSRYREASARTDADYLPADARIISRAVAPRDPSFPKKTMMSVAAAIAALLIAAAILFLREFTSGRAFRIIGYDEQFAAAQPQPTVVAPVIAASYAEVPMPASAPAEPELPLTAKRPDDAFEDIGFGLEPAEPDFMEPRATREDIYQSSFGARELTEQAEPSEPAAARETEWNAPEPDEPAIVLSEADPVETDRGEPEAAEFDVAEAEPAESPFEPLAPEEDEPPFHEIALPARPIADAEASDEEEFEDEFEAEDEAEETEEDGGEEEVERDRAGSAELAEILSSSAVRIALFAGAEGGEGAGEIAYSAARVAARDKIRCVLIDVGREPSEALGLERPGLEELLAGDAAFGEVIRRDEETGVHVIPLGGTDVHPPLQRMQIVVNALTHTYDKVIIVADALDDWPYEHVRPDIAAIVCSPELSEPERTGIYDLTLARGARNAIIVRYSSDLDDEASAAA